VCMVLGTCGLRHRASAAPAPSSARQAVGAETPKPPRASLSTCSALGCHIAPSQRRGQADRRRQPPAKRVGPRSGPVFQREALSSRAQA